MSHPESLKSEAQRADAIIQQLANGRSSAVQPPNVVQQPAPIPAPQLQQPPAQAPIPAPQAPPQDPRSFNLHPAPPGAPTPPQPPVQQPHSQPSVPQQQPTAAPNAVNQEPDPRQEPGRVQPDASGQFHDWKLRYTNYRQQVDPELNRLRHEVSSAATREAGLLRQIADLEYKLSTTPGAAQSPANGASGTTPPINPVSANLTDDERNMIGAENAEIVTKMVNDISTRHMQEVQQIQAAQSRAEQTRREADHAEQRASTLQLDSFKASLRSVVSDFDALDASPEFAQYLMGIDQLAGVPRKQLYVKAYQAGDVNRVAEFYTGFQSQSAVTEDPRMQMISPAGAPVANATGNPMNPVQQSPSYTMADLDQFYQDDALGRLKHMSAEDKQQLEKDILLSLGIIRQ